MRDRTSPSIVSFIAVLVLAGTTFAVSPEKVLYSFKGGPDGAVPNASLIADAAGNFYGTTTEGGAGNCSGGCGTVFELKPPAARNGAWTETVLYSFQGGNDAAGPQASLVFDAAGNLYGTTLSGGGSLDGAVFQLSPPAVQGGPWTETVIYRFTGGNNGEYPVASLVFDRIGNLYGTTVFGGGAPQAGVVFQLTPPAVQGGPWGENVLHQFGHGNDGANPTTAVLVDRNGALFGTTKGDYVSGSGVFFKLTPPAGGQGAWIEAQLYHFSGFGDGSEPGEITSVNGTVYGTATLGGAANQGTFFQLVPSGGIWTESTLYGFQGGNDGSEPLGRLVRDRNGNFYGTTNAGGQSNHGTVYQLSPPGQQGGSWTKTTLYEFAGGSDGSNPGAGLVFGTHGALYGTTTGGGTSGNGTVFSVMP